MKGYAMRKIGLGGLTFLVLAGLLAGAPAQAAKFDVQFFDPAAPRYTEVIIQQGRVQLDEDYDEEVILEIFAKDLGQADLVLARKVAPENALWVLLGSLNDSGEWEKNMFHLGRELYPAVAEGLRLLILIKGDEATPTYLAYSRVSVVPNPGTLLLLSSGLGFLAWRRFHC